MAEYRLKISGMYCVQCEQRIRRALEGIRGVHNINVSYKRARAEFESDDGVTYDAALKAIEAEGYSVAARAGGRFRLKGAVSLAAALGKKFAHAVQVAGAVIVAVMGLALLTRVGRAERFASRKAGVGPLCEGQGGGYRRGAAGGERAYGRKVP